MIRYVRLKQANQPLAVFWIAYEANDDGSARIAIEQVGRPLVEWVLESHGTDGVRTMYRNIRADLARRVAEAPLILKTWYDYIDTSAANLARTHEEWERLIGLPLYRHKRSA